MRTASALLCCLAALSCTAREAVEFPAPRHSTPFVEALELDMARVAVAVVCDRELGIGNMLGAPLAAELGADDVGVVKTVAEAEAGAAKTKAGQLLTCTVLEYDPYDPSRLVVRAALTDLDATLLSWEDIVANDHAPCATGSREPVDEQVWSKTVSVDASCESVLNEFAYEHLGDSWGSSQDLLEAEILLRDPERFVPFAARQVAQAVRVCQSHP